MAKTNACAKTSTFAGVFPVQVLNRRCLAVDADDVIDAVLVRNRKELIRGFFNREIINHFTVFINDDVFGLIRRSEEHTSELQSRGHLVCRLLLEKKKYIQNTRCC